MHVVDVFLSSSRRILEGENNDTWTQIHTTNDVIFGGRGEDRSFVPDSASRGVAKGW